MLLFPFKHLLHQLALAYSIIVILASDPKTITLSKGLSTPTSASPTVAVFRLTRVQCPFESMQIQAAGLLIGSGLPAAHISVASGEGS